MRKVLLILTLLPFFAFQCKKDKVDKCLKGKVIRITCASFVIQVLNDGSIGDDQWKDSASGEQNTYDNVFSVSNKCEIPSSYKPGDIVYFSLEEPVPNQCIVCAMYDAPPKAQYHVRNISATPCDSIHQ